VTSEDKQESKTKQDKPKVVSLRDRIAAKDDIKAERVTVWGEEIEVREMTGFDRARYMSLYTSEGDVDTSLIYPTLVMYSCYDPETGERIFTEDDIEMLGNKAFGSLDEISTVASRLSGLTKSSKAELGKDSSTENDASTSS
jgi:hypothetical protein